MILDTNAYSALLRGAPEIIQSLNGVQQLAIPLNVITELRFGFAMGNQQAHNEEVLQRFLAQNKIEVLLPSIQTTEQYARVASYCRKNGRALSHNDLWIAALALENDQPLVTYDQDFTALKPLFTTNLIILSNS